MRKFKFKSIEEKQIEFLESENADLLFKMALNETKTGVLENENAKILFKLALMEVEINV